MRLFDVLCFGFPLLWDGTTALFRVRVLVVTVKLFLFVTGSLELDNEPKENNPPRESKSV